jgi:putative oxidoreductase
MNAVERFRSWAPAILGITRILSGAMFVGYGAQKLLGAFGGLPPGVGGFQVNTAGVIELVGGALIMIGLFTRTAAFIASGLMAFAYFIGHAGNGFWPHANGGEIAILYCWLFLYIAAQGPGWFAIDNFIGRRRDR